MNREIEVWADWQELGGTRQMGTLWVIESRGKEVFSFQYDRDWLESELSHQLDPDLQLLEGPQYLNSETRPNFGLFLDSSPDRWGRVLMQRREAAQARAESRKVVRLQETDFLLGVHDEQRLGALRFREPSSGRGWLSSDDTMATPPWTSLRELERASWKLQREDVTLDADQLKWLSLMIAPGSSLGGARPKAGVEDEHGALWIAKFPGRNDSRDVAAWEMVAHQLAAGCGVTMSDARLEKFGKNHRTFLSRRFDRVLTGNKRVRVHFASAMTLLGYNDGDGIATGVSYLELAEWIIRHGARPQQDLQQLWRRIVFSIAISNTDDHLRNHGFLLSPEGWHLSPAYDINPDPDGHGLSLNISEVDNALEFDLALEVAEFFRLSLKQAKTIIKEVKQPVSRWRALASQLKISRAAQEEMAEAFRC